MATTFEQGLSSREAALSVQMANESVQLVDATKSFPRLHKFALMTNLMDRIRHLSDSRYDVDDPSVSSGNSFDRNVIKR